MQPLSSTTIVYIMRRCRFGISAGTRVSSRSPGSPATRFQRSCGRWRGSSISAASSCSRATSNRRSRSPRSRARRSRWRGELPLWVSVDQEGGRVARLRSPFTVWPPMLTLGRSGDEALAERFARALAAELRAVGISLDYTPVLDIHTNPKNPVIGDRALADTPKTSRGSGPRHHRDAAGAKASPPAASTFPGTATPAPTRITSCRSIEHPPDRLDAVELVPFKRGDRGRRRVDHDGAHPGPGARRGAAGDAVAARSSTACSRRSWASTGLVFTDDLEMKAISARYGIAGGDGARRSRAGCDAVLMCGDSPGAAVRGARGA